MVADAEAHRSEDAAFARGGGHPQRAGHRGLSGTADPGRERRRIPEHERARAELLVDDARTALDQQADIDRLRPSPVSCTSYSNHWLLPPRPAPQLEPQLVRSESSSGESGDDSDDVIDDRVHDTLIMSEQQTHEQQSNEQPPAPEGAANSNPRGRPS